MSDRLSGHSHADDGSAHMQALRVELFAALSRPDDHAAARERLVHLHVPMVEHCARRFRNRGEPLEDLHQVGLIGLLKAIDRFDPHRGVEFSTFAMPTILGESKRHFRDRGWAIRVPRRLQELKMQISAARGELTQQLGRSPTPSELSHALGCSVDEVIEALESGQAYATVPLDGGGTDGEPWAPAAAAQVEAGLERVDDRESIKPLLLQLNERDRQILLLRFFREMTQSQIAAEVGISQMHVSRLLARTLGQLRESLLTED